MLDRDRFIAECRTATAGRTDSRAVREIVARAVADPAALMRCLGEPTKVGFDVLHRSPSLTILNTFWAPHMVIMPHNHAMAAIIGVYAGREDNMLWRRLPDDAHGRIEAAGAKFLGPGDTCAFGPDLIHSVVNPTTRVTGAIHVYAGDFFGVDRSEWEPDTLDEKPYDMQKVLRMFEANPLGS